MAKSKPTKLPKRIAGVKVPKRMRRPGGKVLDALSHPLVADMVAAGLIAAAAAVRDSNSVRRAANKAGEKALDLRSGAATLGTIIAARAGEGARRLNAAYGELSAEGNAQESETAKSSGKKKAKKKSKD